MTRLTDLQSILLTHAASHDDGSLLAPPDSVAGEPARVMTAITQLLRRGLLEERPVGVSSALAREEGDLRYGAFITVAGLTAIGVELGTAPESAASVPAATEAAAAPPATKAALVLGLLRRDEGATLAELVGATGWLPHTTRAALTGLRKKGHAIERFSREGATCYRIAVAQ